MHGTGTTTIKANVWDTHLLEQGLGIDEFGMPLHGCHALDEADTRRVQGADDETGETSGERSGAFPVLARDRVPMSDVGQGINKILRMCLTLTRGMEEMGR